MSAIRSARSVAGLYNLATNGKTLEDKITVLLQVRNPSIRSMLETQKDIIVALTKGSGQCLFVEKDDEVPRGVGSEVVSTDVTVHIPVQVSTNIFRHCADGAEQAGVGVIWKYKYGSADVQRARSTPLRKSASSRKRPTSHNPTRTSCSRR